MSIKKIKQHNPQKFLDDLRRVRDIMVIMPKSNACLHVKKSELMREAQEGKIHYWSRGHSFKVGTSLSSTAVSLVKELKE